MSQHSVAVPKLTMVEDSMEPTTVPHSTVWSLAFTYLRLMTNLIQQNTRTKTKNLVGEENWMIHYTVCVVWEENWMTHYTVS